MCAYLRSECTFSGGSRNYVKWGAAKVGCYRSAWDGFGKGLCLLCHSPQLIFRHVSIDVYPVKVRGRGGGGEGGVVATVRRGMALGRGCASCAIVHS